MVKITPTEYMLMRKYIEDQCAIHLETDKEYLIETRLSDLMAEIGCKTFQEFHFRARTDTSGKIRDRIIDAMTTNETSWFRDKIVWDYIRDTIVPALVDQALQTGKSSIWSSAVSTGQEIYSLLMLLDEETTNRRIPSVMERIEIIATDISSSALSAAIKARYDAVSISRGLPTDKMEKYFTFYSDTWEFDARLKSRVKFQRFNLQEPFNFLNLFDLILCRYVSIYFSDSFKQKLFSRMASVLKPGGVLLLGATESLRDFSDAFDIATYKNVVVNTRKKNLNF